MGGLGFDGLQSKLVGLWPSIRTLTDDPQTIVVVPSMTISNIPLDSLAPSLPAYEERFLFLLLLLRQPNARLVYVTSKPVPPRLIDSYLDLVPGLDTRETRDRLFMVAAGSDGSRPLSEVLLDEPALTAHIRALVVDPDRAHLVPYNTSQLEEHLAVELGIPLYGAGPDSLVWGTKSGGRRLFADEGIPHPAGIEGVGSRDELIEAVAALVAARPALAEVMVKLDEGLGGQGNASLAIAGLEGDRAAIERRVHSIRPEQEMAPDEFLAALEKYGGVVEERITGDDFRSPSVQVRIAPTGEVELLSSHDQVLGGPTGQSYLGCRFPADPGYAAAMCADGVRIGERLAREGVLGRFAVDFVTVRRPDGTWDHFAIEINVRKGGTTHPFLTMQLLTDGRYEPESNRFVCPDGEVRCYVATDHLESDDYLDLTAAVVLDGLDDAGLGWDPDRRVGVVPHMLSDLPVIGRAGATAIAPTMAEADWLLARTRDLFDALAR